MFEGVTEFFKMKYADYLKRQIRPSGTKWLTRCFQNYQHAIIDYDRKKIEIVKGFNFKVKSVFNELIVDNKKLIIISRAFVKFINKEANYLPPDCSTEM